MGIQTNKAKVTIDFIWSGKIDDADVEYQVKYHHTEDFGPTISISTDGGDDYYGFPADMFSEVVDFLRGEKMLKSSSVPDKEAVEIRPTKKTLPAPIVACQEEKEEQKTVEVSTVTEPFEVSSDQVQSFADPVDGGESEIEEPVEVKPKPKKKLNAEIDAQQAALERQAAIERAAANRDKRKIRRDNKEETE